MKHLSPVGETAERQNAGIANEIELECTRLILASIRPMIDVRRRSAWLCPPQIVVMRGSEVVIGTPASGTPRLKSLPSGKNMGAMT